MSRSRIRPLLIALSLAMLAYQAGAQESRTDECIEPEPTYPDATHPSPEWGPDPTIGPRDLSIKFSDSTTPTDPIVRESIAPEDVVNGAYLFNRGSLTLSVLTVSAPPPTYGVTLLYVNDPVETHTIETSYTIDPTGNGLIVNRVTILDSAGAPAASHSPAGSLANPPGNCQEEAMIRFGPLPYGFPVPFHFPEMEGCNWSKCSDVNLGVLHAIHGLWRFHQLMAVVNNMPSAQRPWAWSRRGTDLQGNQMPDWTSPEFWFGSYNADRFSSIKQFVASQLQGMIDAEIDGSDLKYECGGLLCGGGSGSEKAYASWRGDVHLCNELWNGYGGQGHPDWEKFFQKIITHEPMHWRKVDYGWYKAYITDSHRHSHGNLCLSGDWSKDYMGFPNNFAKIRELATYQNNANPVDDCGHRHDTTKNVDTYAMQAVLIGREVKYGGFRIWPQPAPPTPTPPACVGGANCLCQNVAQYGAEPDGDFSILKFCQDEGGGPLECMATKFGAQTEGICIECDGWGNRGPGCPCNDVTLPCHVGTCWGDDTQGQGSSMGQCYVDPPDFACLADCDELLGSGSFCMHNHPTRARCVPVGTSLPEATNCWESGGWMEPNELECETNKPMCGAGAIPATPAVVVDCVDDLGYPPPYYCGPQGRCIANP